MMVIGGRRIISGQKPNRVIKENENYEENNAVGSFANGRGGGHVEGRGRVWY